MKVVILCGGFGTRIKDVSTILPKSMIPIDGKPLIWHIMKYFSHCGYNEFVLCLGYKGDVIKNYFLNYSLNESDFTLELGNEDSIEYHNQHDELEWKITFVETGLDSLTGKRIKKIEKYIKEDNFMVTYGDCIADVDIDKLIEFHKNHNKILTVTGIIPVSKYGEFLENELGIVTQFIEKPEITQGCISGGFFVCKKEIFDYLDLIENQMFEKEPLNKLVKDCEMKAFKHKGFWHAMDTPKDYLFLSDLCKKKEAKWIKWR